jgi:hypothetical protein
LNRVSRRRSLLGRVESPGGAESGLDRNVPAMTRMGIL